MGNGVRCDGKKRLARGKFLSIVMKLERFNSWEKLSVRLNTTYFAENWKLKKKKKKKSFGYYSLMILLFIDLIALDLKIEKPKNATTLNADTNAYYPNGA